LIRITSSLVLLIILLSNLNYEYRDNLISSVIISFFPLLLKTSKMLANEQKAA
jgi:hypothetical protein